MSGLEAETKERAEEEKSNTESVHCAIYVQEIHGDTKHLFKNPFAPNPSIVSHNDTKIPYFPLVLLYCILFFYYIFCFVLYILTSI